MPQMIVPSNAKEAFFEITVTRADGRVEHYGIVSYYNKNPLKNFLMNLYIQLRDSFRKMKAN